MVFFTCNACREALKKGQVEKHVNMCQNCQCLSCMDCRKDTWDEDYKYHVKCLSEVRRKEVRSQSPQRRRQAAGSGFRSFMK